MSKNEKQPELFQAQTTWFHVFKDMIDSGDLAKIDGSAIKCYLVIKAYSNYSTGHAFPAHETIAEAAGLSVAQVKRCIATLEEYGYISKEKRGRHNLYTLREKVCITDDEGRPAAVATWDYVPGMVKEAVADLRNVLVRPELDGAKIVHIERMQLIVGDHNVMIGENNDAETAMLALAEKNPKMFEKIAAMRLSAKGKAG